MGRARARKRSPEEPDIERLIHSIDQERRDYIRLYFGCDRKNMHLYQMLLSSELGEEPVADMIAAAIVR